MATPLPFSSTGNPACAASCCAARARMLGAPRARVLSVTPHQGSMRSHVVAVAFSGTGTLACAPLLRRNPCDLGFRPKSHPVNVRRQAEACPTENHYYPTQPTFPRIANPSTQQLAAQARLPVLLNTAPRSSILGANRHIVLLVPPASGPARRRRYKKLEYHAHPANLAAPHDDTLRPYSRSRAWGRAHRRRLTGRGN
jgi:hypothetical protein